MLWIEAKVVDIACSKRLLNFGTEILSFVSANSDRKLALESVRFWNDDKRIVLPFHAGSVSVGLSFLIGVAELSSINVVSACKKWSLQKRGYELLGFRIDDNGLVAVEKQDFHGFGSDNWQVLRIGDDGYSVCVHVQGSVSIWRFSVDEVGGKLILNRKLALSLHERRILVDEERLRRAMIHKSGIDKDDVELLINSIYNCFRDIQCVLIPNDDAASFCRSIAP